MTSWIIFLCLCSTDHLREFKSLQSDSETLDNNLITKCGQRNSSFNTVCHLVLIIYCGYVLAISHVQLCCCIKCQAFMQLIWKLAGLYISTLQNENSSKRSQNMWKTVITSKPRPKVYFGWDMFLRRQEDNPKMYIILSYIIFISTQLLKQSVIEPWSFKILVLRKCSFVEVW